MCVNSCVCYARDIYRDRDTCPFCHEPRRTKDGRPRNQYRYNPFTPRLLAMQRNPSTAQAMQYRATRSRQPGHMSDIFDASLYQDLLGKHVEVNGTTLPHKHFSDKRDIALGLTTDGFAPFKKRKSTSWPILLIVYNLAPDVRCHLENVLCLGEIPGPRKPKDWDSFLWPALIELVQLMYGVEAFDGLTRALFVIHAYLLLVFGDMPAVSMMMRMLGHNAISPCRACEIRGVRIPDKPRVTTHYVPLHRSNHPSAPEPPEYDASHLPMRTPESFVQHAQDIQAAPSKAARSRLQTRTGIKGLPALGTLSSISLPHSFPHDFMHLIFENIIPNLTLLWTGRFKDFPTDDDFVLAPHVWEAISEAGRNSKGTIPSAFGAAVPNLNTERSHMTAETWGFWATFIAPVLLRRRFKREAYYKHFVVLVTLVQKCLQFEYTEDEIDEIEKGFSNWVRTYEKCVLFFPNSLSSGV